MVMRVVVAKDYNRALARPIYNCPDCYQQKEHSKRVGSVQKETSRP